VCIIVTAGQRVTLSEFCCKPVTFHLLECAVFREANLICMSMIAETVAMVSCTAQKKWSAVALAAGQGAVWRKF